LGASGNTGSIIANFLLLKGEKVRVVGRDVGRLERFVPKARRLSTADMSDAAALTKAFSAARAAYLILPPLTPGKSKSDRSDAIAKAVKESGLRYAVHLSSYAPCPGRHRTSHRAAFFGAKTKRDQRFECPAPASCVFHGKQSGGDRHDSWDGIGSACIATRPESCHDLDARRWRLRRAAPSGPGFSGKQTRELLGERDLSMAEATGIIARGLGKPDLRYEQFRMTRCDRR